LISSIILSTIKLGVTGINLLATFKKISDLLKRLKPPNMDKEDQDVNTQNMKLIKNTMFYLLIGALVAIV